MIEEKLKVFVIGIDGAPFHLIESWAKADELPTLKMLMKKGASGVLQSSIPPTSLTAWASLMTGKNPGKHGILDFTLFKGDWHSIRPANANDIYGTTIWEILSYYDKRVGVINVPMTYPPRRVNGFLISGFPLPNKCLNYTYPPELALELHRHAWLLSDIAAQAYYENLFPSFLKGLYSRLENRANAAVYLMDKYEWDFFMVHFLETDKVQHEFWEYMERKSRGKKDPLTEKYGDAVLRLFQKVDEIIDKLINKLDEDTVVMIISDHGFGLSRHLVYMNNWLRREGFMHLKKGVTVSLKRLLFQMGLTPCNFLKLIPKSVRGNIQDWINKKYYLEREEHAYWNLNNLVTSLLGNVLLTFNDVDWSMTKAYCIGNSGLGHIYINTNMRDKIYEKTRDNIIIRLKEFKDPWTGKPIIDKIYKKEEIYFGENLDRAADLIVLFREFDYTDISPPFFISNTVVEKHFFSRGMSSHNMEGLVILYGRNVKQGKCLKNLSIVDITPTILYIMGIPIPKDMDGQVIEECFIERFRRNHPIRYSEDSEQKWKPCVKKSPLSTEEEEKILKRLRKMGYI